MLVTLIILEINYCCCKSMLSLLDDKSCSNHGKVAIYLTCDLLLLLSFLPKGNSLLSTKKPENKSSQFLYNSHRKIIITCNTN